jgi:hypothetical protein
MRRGRVLMLVAVGLLDLLVMAPSGLAAGCPGWVRVASPSPGPHFNQLLAVAALSPASAWAVGDAQVHRRTVTVVLRWNGSRWRVVASPSPAPQTDTLNDVALVAAGNVWAVGQRGQRTLVEHWNGSRWRVISSPSPFSGRVLGGRGCRGGQ